MPVWFPVKRINIIFLDVDGVLNGYNRWNTFGWNIICWFKSEKLRNWYRKITKPCGVHVSKVKRLAKIVRATNAKIVMSSSWRFAWRRYRPMDFDELGGNFKILRDSLIKYKIDVIDITPRLEGQGRDSEIIQWLSQNEDMVKNFVILDDENSFMKAFWDDERFIQTSEVPKGILITGKNIKNAGLKRKHVKKAIKILQGADQ